MSKRKNEKDQDIEMIPIVETEMPQEDAETEDKENDLTEVIGQDTKEVPQEETDTGESDASALFGAYVAEENKWERKNRIRDEKQKKKQTKKREKYKDVDDETFEHMKARPAHVFFGILSILLLLAGIGLATLSVFKLVVSPSYAEVSQKEKNLPVEGIATNGDAESIEEIAALAGVATPSDLVDTWIEQEFATETDAEPSGTETEDTTQTDDESAQE